MIGDRLEEAHLEDVSGCFRPISTDRDEEAEEEEGECEHSLEATHRAEQGDGGATTYWTQGSKVSRFYLL